MIATDADSLLRAILDRPEDDAPRLAYADWLDENGQPERAEFIRVQCELARLGPPPVVVTERCVLSRRYGPGYYTLSGGEGTADGGILVNEIKVGSRVDVLNPRGKRPRYGLRVHRIGQFNDPGADSEVVLAEDGESRPWAGWDFRKRERELWDAGALDWFFGLPVNQVLLPDAPVPADRRSVAIVRRGFVAEVRTTLAGFMDGPCEGCTNTVLARGWVLDSDDRPVTCPDCSGSGRRAGAAAVARSQPVCRVVLMDKEPEHVVRGPGENEWTWFVGDAMSLTSSAHIPNVIWHHMGRTWHPTREAALAALSAACLKHVQAEAPAGR